MPNPSVDLYIALEEMERLAEQAKRELEEASRQAARWRARVDALTQQHNGYLFGAQNLRAALSYHDESDKE
jgi:hypothetical protein